MSYIQEYYKKNKARINAQHKKYYIEHREERLAKNREYYQNHKEQMNAKNREWAKAHPEEIKAIKNRWAEKNRELDRRIKRDSVCPYRPIWENHFRVKIPEGYVIHHKDGNGSNNNPYNLLCIPTDLHTKLHWLKGDIRG